MNIISKSFKNLINIIYKPFKNLIKIFKSEFSIQFTPGKILIMLFSILLPVLVTFFLDDLNEVSKNAYDDLNSIVKIQILNKNEWIREFKINQSNRFLNGPMISQGITYAIIFRIYILFLDKNTIDKNRLSYLKYNKNLVSFSKIFVDLFLFVLHLIILMISGVSIVLFRLNGEFEMKTYSNLIKIIIGLAFFYLFSGYGVKFLVSSLDGYKFKWTAIVFWLSFTIVYFLLLSPLMQIDEIKNFYINNINWIIYIPFMNLLSPTLLLQNFKNSQGEQLIDLISMVPMIAMNCSFILFTWYWFTIKQKEFLCT